jgi:hypothetical protein
MDPLLLWIVGSGLLMSAIALVGSFTLALSEQMPAHSAAARGVRRRLSARRCVLSWSSACEHCSGHDAHDDARNCLSYSLLQIAGI